MSESMGRAAPRALRLQSPGAGRRLFGLDGDRVFVTPGEKVAYELDEVQLSPRALSAARPERTAEGSVFWLPFWRFRFAVEVSGEGEAVSNVRRVFEESSAYVRAFSLVNALYVGDPGLKLTLESYEPNARLDLPPVGLGARLGSKEARAIARLFLLEKADRILDVTGARVRTEVLELELLLLPFDRKERYFEMLVGPRTRFREETLVDLRGIEAAHAAIGRALR